MKLRELAERIGGRIAGNPEVEITGVSGIDEAGEGEITLLLDRKGLKKDRVRASALIVKTEMEDLAVSMLVSENPLYTFARALEVFHAAPRSAPGVSGKAFVGDNVVMGEDVTVGPFAHISGNVTLGSRVTVSSGVFVGDGTSIGDDSFIYPNASIREKIAIGRNVIIHSGAVIGSDGFGYVPAEGKHYKIPQVGGVIIEDEVEIGANVCIDRGTTGNTIIGRGTKIDNLAQIAHNVKIGKNCIIVSQVGISGSVVIGDGVILAGQVGIRDHITIGNKAVIGAQSGVGADVPEGKVYSGSPAIPHGQWLRAQHIYSRLPEYVKRIQELERTLRKEEPQDDEHS